MESAAVGGHRDVPCAGAHFLLQGRCPVLDHGHGRGVHTRRKGGAEGGGQGGHVDLRVLDQIEVEVLGQ